MIVPHSMNSDLCLDRLIEDICRSNYAIALFQYVTIICFGYHLRLEHYSRAPGSCTNKHISGYPQAMF